LIFGAHPDDAEFHAGGLVSIYRALGFPVKMVSVTNGEAGHHKISGPELTAIRRVEAAAAAAFVGAESEVWDHPDGRLQVSLEVRWQIVREIRKYAPDLVLTHRTVDYHPDHRAVGELVRDACYLVTVPSLVPDAPILRKDPVVAFLSDRFTRPCPHVPDVVIDIGSVVDSVVHMLACHRSQFFEWLPFNRGVEDQVPSGETDRIAWLREWYCQSARETAIRARESHAASTAAAKLGNLEFAEVFEISEYGSLLTPELRLHLFPGVV
jgi:LmbE family N-acetylglucosaminyl deacetylase